MPDTEPRTLPIARLQVGSVPAAVLVRGDPARTTKTTEHLQNVELLSEQREYRIYRGEYEHTPVALCSHGIGAAGACIAFEELIAAGAKRLIRIGTCGGLQTAVRDGDLVMGYASLVKVGSLRGVQTAAILAVDGNVMHDGESMDAYDSHRSILHQAVEDEIDIALRAMAQISGQA